MAWLKRFVAITNSRGHGGSESLSLFSASRPRRQARQGDHFAFPIRGKLEELRQQQEARLKEEGRVPIDPTVFWIKQTVRFRWWLLY
jgi:hypothetical protein